ncbi:histone-lysine N-methyltransferase SETMAR [Trichonephila clavipes]|nr:histone-lysine N-methyltransferase SETMAR [Trichonephila clavipes]
MPTQIKNELGSVYGDSAPSFTTVKVWAAEFKSGRKSSGDDERSGRPNTATADETITKVHQMVLDNHRFKRKTLTPAYYASLLDKLKAELAEKRSHLQEKKNLFHQDNATPHTSGVAMAKIH